MDITFKECEVSNALELRILQHATKLERIYDRITRCEVAVEHRKRTYRVRVRLTVPGGEIVATSPDAGDAYLAVQDAFLAARRQLENYADQLRHDHRTPVRVYDGRIKRVSPRTARRSVARDGMPLASNAMKGHGS